MKKFTKILPILIIIVILGTIASIMTTIATPTLSRPGSRGTEVKQIQTKLKALGLYAASIDGIYGVKTTAGVKAFQRRKGLTPDGIAGPATLRALGVTTSTAPTTNRSNDINLLARVISAESRGEPYTGQVAVGAVILNRIKHPSFPNTLAGVIYQPGAFTCVSDGQINAPVEAVAHRAASDAMNGWDPTHGCIYYYNPAKTTNKWIYSRPVVITIGKHVFAR